MACGATFTLAFMLLGGIPQDQQRGGSLPTPSSQQRLLPSTTWLRREHQPAFSFVFHALEPEQTFLSSAAAVKSQFT
eukprot:222839-Rhodomonas_salina.3